MKLDSMKLFSLFLLVTLLSCSQGGSQDSLFIFVELKPADPNTQQFINLNIPSGQVIVDVRYIKINDAGTGSTSELFEFRIPDSINSFNLPADFTISFPDESSFSNGSSIFVDVVDENNCVQFCGSNASLDTSVIGSKSVVRLEPLGASSFCARPQTQTGVDCN